MSTDLPEWSSGSEKQIAWAAEIRAELVTEIGYAVDFYNTPLSAEDSTLDLEQRWRAAAAALTEQLEKVVCAHTDAAWWIESREALWAHVLHPAAKKAGTRQSAIANKIIDARGRAR